MKTKYKSIEPRDVFPSYFVLNEYTLASSLTLSSEKQTCQTLGVELFDMFIDLIRRHGHFRSGFCAYCLGVDSRQFCIAIKVLTGYTVLEWRDHYVLQGVRELLVYTKASHEQISKQMGFTSARVMSRYLISHVGQNVAEWRMSERTKLRAKQSIRRNIEKEKAKKAAMMAAEESAGGDNL